MLKYRKTLTLLLLLLLLFKPCRLLIHASRHAYIVAAKLLKTKGNSKDYHVSAMDLYVLLDFGQYQIYFLSFYEMNPDCYFDIYF